MRKAVGIVGSSVVLAVTILVGTSVMRNLGIREILQRQEEAAQESQKLMQESASAEQVKDIEEEKAEDENLTAVEEAPHGIVQSRYDVSVYTENGIEFHRIAGDTWQGVMMVVPDAERVFVGMPNDTYNGAPGGNAGTIARRYDALASVNGAFFVDTNYTGNGGTPIGFVFSEGKQTYGGTATTYRLMGFDLENHFVCEDMTGEEAAKRGIRDAVTCNPYLVQNGEPADLRTKNTTLVDARTAIGAREDGAVLLLTIDGRTAHSIGATTQDEVDIMLSFGAVNAGNLDGGGSLSFYYDGTPVEGLSSVYGERAVPNAFCIRRES